MARLLVLAVAAAVLDVFALIDLAFIDRMRIRTMNKTAWALIIILVPIVGALLWFFIGRGRGFTQRRKRGPVAPDDDPAFLRRIREEQEAAERIRRMEQELADLDTPETDPQPPEPGTEPGPDPQPER